jgi:hypothetical protein
MCLCEDAHDEANGRCHRPITTAGYILCEPCAVHCNTDWEYIPALHPTQHATTEDK